MTANKSISIVLTRTGTPQAWMHFAGNPLDVSLSFAVEDEGNTFDGASALRIELHEDRLIDPERPALALLEIASPTGTTASGTFTAPQMNQDLLGSTQRAFWLVVHGVYPDEDIADQTFQIGTLTLLAHPASLTVAAPPALASALTSTAADLLYRKLADAVPLADLPLLDPTANAANEIDSRLTGSPTLPLFTTANHAAGSYARSATCWAATVDLTGIGVAWQSGGVWTSQLGFTAITPRHVVICNHSIIPNGSTLRFVTAGNTVVDRTLVGSVRIDSSDIRVGTLNADLPASITPVYLPPPTAGLYLRRAGLPILTLDQDGKALVAEMMGTAALVVPATAPRSSYFETAVTGDSGHPWLAVQDGRPMLLSFYTSTAAGPDIPSHQAAILIACGAYAPAVPAMQRVDWSAITNAPGMELVSSAGGNGEDDGGKAVLFGSDGGITAARFSLDLGLGGGATPLTAWATAPYPTGGGYLRNFGGVLSWATSLTADLQSNTATIDELIVTGSAAFSNSDLSGVGGIQATGDIEIINSAKGLILRSPNGARWRITVSNAGTLSAAAI